jgi:hypothetical protein
MFEHIVQMGPMPAMLVIGCAGAALAIAAQRRLWRSALLEA